MKKILLLLIIVLLVGCTKQVIEEPVPEPVLPEPEPQPVENGELWLYNTLTNEFTFKVEIGMHPAHVQATNTKAYVTNQEDNTISVVDLLTREATSFVTGKTPYGLALSPDQSTLAVVTKDDAMLRTYDLDGVEQITVSTALNPKHVAFSPEGKYAFVTSTDGQVYKINMIVKQIVEQGPSGVLPNYLAATPERLFAVNKLSNDVAVLNAINMIAAAPNINVGTDPYALVIGGAYAYVTNSGDNTVSVVSIPEQMVVDTVPVGDTPRGIAFNPAVGTQGTLYVANHGSNDVSVIDISTLSEKKVSSGIHPYQVTVTPDGKYFLVVVQN